jgi:hypothetical protein
MTFRKMGLLQSSGRWKKPFVQKTFGTSKRQLVPKYLSCTRPRVIRQGGLEKFRDDCELPL